MSKYDIFSGTENGLIKGINSQAKTSINLNSADSANLTRHKEIVAMCWLNDQLQNKILLATKDRHILLLDAVNADQMVDLGEFSHASSPPNQIKGRPIVHDLIIGMECLSENVFVTGSESGMLHLWPLDFDPNNQGSDKKPQFLNELHAGSHMTCMKVNKTLDKIATGGKENDLKVWQVKTETNEIEKKALFAGKNVSDNWVQLREAVWVTCVDFLDEKRIVTGTAYHQVRVYDISTGVRKPILNVIFGEMPLTALCVVPDNLNRHIIVANTHGLVEMIDLNAKLSEKLNEAKVVRKFKSSEGTVKGLQAVQIEHELTDRNGNLTGETEKKLLLAVCGLDRFVRVHNVENSQLVVKLFLKSRLSCLLFSRNKPIKEPIVDRTNEFCVDDDQMSTASTRDDLWSDIETVELKSNKKQRIV